MRLSKRNNAFHIAETLQATGITYCRLVVKHSSATGPHAVIDGGGGSYRCVLGAGHRHDRSRRQQQRRSTSRRPPAAAAAAAAGSGAGAPSPALCWSALTAPRTAVISRPRLRQLSRPAAPGQRPVAVPGPRSHEQTARRPALSTFIDDGGGRPARSGGDPRPPLVTRALTDRSAQHGSQRTLPPASHGGTRVTDADNPTHNRGNTRSSRRK